MVSKALLVALFTWLLSALGGALIMSLVTAINLLSGSSESSGFESSGVIWIFGLTLMISLPLLLLIFPLNTILLILIKKLPGTTSSSFKTFLLLAASTILSPFVIAILPYNRSLLFENTFHFALTIAGFVLITFTCFILVKNFRTSITLYVFLNVLSLFVLSFLSRQHDAINYDSWGSLALCSMFHVPGTITLFLFARQFRFFSNATF